MESRLNLRQANPDAMQIMTQMGQYVRRSGLDSSLVQLVEIRASQINGCGR